MRTINSHKYGLKYLKENLNIDIENHHRAYEDARSTVEVLRTSLAKIDQDIKYTEDLIEFSKTADKIDNEILNNPKV